MVRVGKTSGEVARLTDKVSVLVLQELIHHGVDDIIYLPEEVLVYRNLPACIIVRVRNQVDIDLALLGARLLVDCLVLRRCAILVGGGVRVRRLAACGCVLVLPPGRGAARQDQQGAAG